jgi:peptidyl-prolyl cis-trans isomerase D
MKDLRSDFASTEDDSLFLVRYQSSTPYSAEYVKKSEIKDKYKPVLDLEDGEVSQAITKDGEVFSIKKLDERKDEIKFVVFSFDIKADPIATVDKKAEEADDFSFFAEEDGFEEEAERRDFELKEAFATKGNPFIAGLGQSRQIMNFLETAGEGDISNPIELSNQFVVLKVTEITPEGTRPFEEVESQIRTVVTNNKRKEQLVEKVNSLLASNETLQSIASASGKEVATAENLSMNASVIPGAGREPEVIGAIFGLEETDMSAPIPGANAVFLAKVNNRVDASPESMTAADRRQIRQQLQQQKSASFSQVWMEQLKEEADIEDYRATLLRGG